MYKPTLNSSVLSEREESKVDFARKIFGNNAIRLGLVLEIIEEDDDANISGLGPEYNVMAIQQDGGNGSNTTIYKNCINIDAFGGVADYFQFKHRASKDPKKAKKDGSLKEQTGSIVLLLCLDGNSEKAVIIKSVHNPKKNKILTKDKGHHLEGEFNGVNWSVDKDGALTVVFKSATEDDGKPKDEKAGGSTFKFEKDGSVELTNQPTVEGQDKGDTVDFEKLRLDKTKKTVDLEAREDMSFKTDKNVKITAGKSMDIKLKKDLIAAAEGKAAFTVKAAFDIEAKGAFGLKGQAINAESKSLIQMKAQSLFQVDAGSSAIINAPQLLLGPSPSQPALLAFDLITLGTGNLGGPVISNAIAGFSTSILISS